ncbi:FAD/NAD(P)-binding protein [Tropicimonas sediminicola]|uniref:NAD(P)H-flavin reductase n=1 Tax=Tropicimonas sediminicola TaxID=1031541 RepID=A0A239JWV6_9RHOB|nr:FAD/NAD(P)-binding protein [Tropicimonas sediminicola]SNT10159.1 NAD(P)H-flavin reductase [Tropicimonas sediminicola]
MTLPLPDPMLPMRFRVVERFDEQPGVASLALVPVEDAMPLFRPGQFNMLYAFGIGEAAISISGDPHEHGWMVHTIREVGAVSRALARIHPGGMLGLRGPFGAHWPLRRQSGRHLLFVAGGLGLAPLRPAILQALREKTRYASLTLVCGARAPEQMLYRDEVDGWARQPGMDVLRIVDHANAGWTGRVGVVTTLLGAALGPHDPESVSAFVCGPEIMMRFTARDLAIAGVPGGRIWLSLERNMKCAIGRCGRCQWGPDFLCRDGPVLPYDRVARRLAIKEL